jgi:hypothetical protein
VKKLRVLELGAISEDLPLEVAENDCVRRGIYSEKLQGAI